MGHTRRERIQQAKVLDIAGQEIGYIKNEYSTIGFRTSGYWIHQEFDKEYSRTAGPG
jgi:hypothetical protein